MINWLKYSFGNFFSHKLSKEGATRKVWNLIFALIMFLVLLTSFLASGYSFSYWNHYENATNFQEFAYNAFYNEDESKRVNIEINTVNETSYANAYYGQDKNSVVLINTYENEGDAIYKLNDYNLIVDTRDSATSFVEFSVKYYNTEDENDTITADEFRKLTSSSKYVGKVDVTDKLLTYTDQQIIEYTSWLNIYTSTLDSSNQYVSEWNEIKLLDKESKIFKDKTYALYTRAYYCLNVAPTIQTYYQTTYAILDENNQYKYTNYILPQNNVILNNIL